MALTVSFRATNTNGTSATTVAIAPAGNFTPNSFAVLALAYDNSGASGADPFVSIVDSVGNTWTSRANALNDPGAANAGATLRIFTANIATLTTANTITVTFNANTSAKVWYLVEITSNGIDVVPGFSTSVIATGSGVAPTLTLASVNSGDVVFGGIANESATNASNDTDTVNGVWEPVNSNVVGSGTGGMQLITSWKITTGAGSQTFNPGLVTPSDWAAGLISVTEVALVAGTSFDPFGTMGFFGM